MKLLCPEVSSFDVWLVGYIYEIWGTFESQDDFSLDNTSLCDSHISSSDEMAFQERLSLLLAYLYITTGPDGEDVSIEDGLQNVKMQYGSLSKEYAAAKSAAERLNTIYGLE